jgi:hypothetical protein
MLFLSELEPYQRQPLVCAKVGLTCLAVHPPHGLEGVGGGWGVGLLLKIWAGVARLLCGATKSRRSSFVAL